MLLMRRSISIKVAFARRSDQRVGWLQGYKAESLVQGTVFFHICLQYIFVGVELLGGEDWEAIAHQDYANYQHIKHKSQKNVDFKSIYCQQNQDSYRYGIHQR